MKLSGSTKIHDLLKAYPFLQEFLPAYNAKFQMLKNKAMRATVGRVATLKMVSSMGDVALEKLLAREGYPVDSGAGTTAAIQALSNK